ncbi:type IV toxin-antitoxin system AbiEi family antitoxin domain-containing protein [Agromyces subbeticus]|uniref:type IV toxin-antitoxin system AbiEi family antitoxin domain-containing protein n=1 Tax=Agromyces subbeticus TaxID=293890 RepID=UPI00146BBF94|nr:type IV toxin-antitoxin system AbiEi family antitoxin domain-containing protein [Agromyces subbeticus]
MLERFPVNPNGFVLTRDVRAAGRLAQLRNAEARGELERVRAGVYRRPADYDETWSTAKRDAAEYRVKVSGVAQTLSAPIFTGHSAAALLGLPTLGRWPDDVYVLSRDATGHRRAGVTSVARRHEVDVEQLNGIAMTSIEFSLVQLCRRATLTAALTTVDAALHVPRLGAGHAIAPRTTLDRLIAEHQRLLPYPRSRQVDAVLRRATHLAETPLETLSRVVIEELGFPQPELQHELWLPELGRRAFLDFHWPEYGIGAEADGRGKYEAAGDVPTSIATVIAEKEREDAVRRQVQAFTRWNWAEAWGRSVLFTKLRDAGLPVVRKVMALR